MEQEFIDSLCKLYERDLNKLEQELSLYPKEELIWIIDKDIKNSGGNLCLHLCGNLQHFIGKIIGGSDYVRERDLEFSSKNIPRPEILTLISRTREVVLNTLRNMDKSKLIMDYPEKVFGYTMSHMFFLIHLEGHLSYHLGQVNYHRRILAPTPG
jgi:hypothetical protein